MGPSCGGFTCSFAPFRLLSTIQDTRSARPCPNSGVSTPAATFRVGGAVVASATAVGLPARFAAPAAGTADNAPPPAVPVSPGPPVPVVAADMAAAVTSCAFASVLVGAPVLVDGFVDEGVAGGALPSAARLGGVGREAAESIAAVVATV